MSNGGNNNILVIDNYDSFVHNLARYCQRLGLQPLVVRHDAFSLAEIAAFAPQAILLSPGPCTPDEAGICLEVVREFHSKIPILGICLGHQVIAQAMGGRIVRATRPMHGQTSLVQHDDRYEFVGIPDPFAACRYHSLVVEADSLPAPMQISATDVTSSGETTVMAIRHRQLPLVGWQFHPESILTDVGYSLLANYFRLAGCVLRGDVPDLSTELTGMSKVDHQLPAGPVTF